MIGNGKPPMTFWDEGMNFIDDILQGKKQRMSSLCLLMQMKVRTV